MAKTTVYALELQGKLFLSRQFDAIKAKAKPGAKIRIATPEDITLWMEEHPDAPTDVVKVLKAYKCKLEWKKYRSKEAKTNYAHEQKARRDRIAENAIVSERIAKADLTKEWTEEIEGMHADWLDDVAQSWELAHGIG